MEDGEWEGGGKEVAKKRRVYVHACLRACGKLEGVGNAVAATDKHYYARTASTFR